MLKFDIKKLIFDGQHASSYKVAYKLWKVDDKYTTEDLEVMLGIPRKACYSDFFLNYNDTSKDINGICILNHIKPTSVKLTYDEIDYWIKLGVKYKMMPEHLNASKCISIDKENNDNFYLTAAIKCEGVPQAIVYLYLNTIRELYEDPGFVKAVLYLHEILGINYYAAYVFASFFNKTGSGHHILPITKTMSVYSNEHSSNIIMLKSLEMRNPKSILDLNIVRALYKFVNDVNVDKGNSILKTHSKNTIRASRWSCIEKIVNIANKEIETENKMSIPIHYLDNVNIDKIISTTTTNAVKLLKTIK